MNAASLNTAVLILVLHGQTVSVKDRKREEWKKLETNEIDSWPESLKHFEEGSR
jgi:hypothetical protein